MGLGNEPVAEHRKGSGIVDTCVRGVGAEKNKFRELLFFDQVLFFPLNHCQMSPICDSSDNDCAENTQRRPTSSTMAENTLQN